MDDTASPKPIIDTGIPPQTTALSAASNTPAATAPPVAEPAGPASTAPIPMPSEPATPEPATPEPPRHDPSQSVPWNHTNEWRKLPERMDQVWMIGEAVSCACWLAGCAVAAAICWFNGWWHFWQPLVIGLVGAGAILSLASQPLQTRYRYAFNRFMIGDRYLRIRDGWLFRTTTTIPYNRVQHVDTEQGPILRRFGLTTISVHTAVGEHKIESLETAEAERVTALIAERVAVAKEDL